MCGTAVAPAKIHGAIVRILSDFCKLHFAQSNRTFAAVRLLPPFENGMSWSKGRFFLTRGARTLADSDFPQDHLQRAEVSERRLQEVEPDESGEPQPIEAVEVSQQKADEDEDARKSD